MKMYRRLPLIAVSLVLFTLLSDVECQDESSELMPPTKVNVKPSEMIKKEVTLPKKKIVKSSMSSKELGQESLTVPPTPAPELPKEIKVNPTLPPVVQQPAIQTVPTDGVVPAGDNNPVLTQVKSQFITDEVTMPSESEYNITGYTNQTDEAHDYYNSSVITNEQQAKALWIELDDLNDTVTHDMLSESYRRAATVNLTFPFPFYGHPINNVTIATGGFLYVGYKLHMWLAATQYIAPLMANFKASNQSSNSSLKYYDNGTVFVVEWRNVMLEDDKSAGPFTFQTSLHKNGDIYFVYKNIPKNITDINEKNHPVKVGISDAYLFKRVVFLLKRKTIYEYHSVNKKTDAIRSNSAIVLRALPTCVSLTTCQECTTAQINFNCTWCEAVQRCSSGLDRHRQSWMSSKCDDNITPKGQCPAGSAGALAALEKSSMDSGDGASGGRAGFSALFVFLSLIFIVAGWVVYAYRNPRSPSGQFLIKYRPSQWKRHGEARYIAAGSLHM